MRLWWGSFLLASAGNNRRHQVSSWFLIFFFILIFFFVFKWILTLWYLFWLLLIYCYQLLFSSTIIFVYLCEWAVWCPYWGERIVRAGRQSNLLCNSIDEKSKPKKKLYYYKYTTHTIKHWFNFLNQTQTDVFFYPLNWILLKIQLFYLFCYIPAKFSSIR